MWADVFRVCSDQLTFLFKPKGAPAQRKLFVQGHWVQGSCFYMPPVLMTGWQQDDQRVCLKKMSGSQCHEMISLIFPLESGSKSHVRYLRLQAFPGINVFLLSDGKSSCWTSHQHKFGTLAVSTQSWEPGP